MSKHHDDDLTIVDCDTCNSSSFPPLMLVVVVVVVAVLLFALLAAGALGGRSSSRYVSIVGRTNGFVVIVVDVVPVLSASCRRSSIT